MSYIPLAVKYRPQKFSDFVGQQGTLKALTNGIALGREPRCIIFSGIRGVGKTTLARLYAMALNCENPTGGEPCGTCGNCRSIQSGTHENVTEIDGASNTSVEDVRELQETMSYVPQRGRFKVYIVDEVHMLSNSAFNAFLKTLEEPPADVVFILATTELDKIPKTVQSRCQTFFLAKMSPDEIKQNLARILDAEGISYQASALQIVALEGQGSMRDALTFLDQVIAMTSGELTEEMLAEFSQNLPFTACIEFLQAMMTKDGAALIDITAGWHDKGIDYRKTTAELVRILRNSMILAGIGDSAISRKAMALSDGECDATLELALGSHGGPMDTNRMFRVLVSLYHQLDGSFLDRFLMENVCLEWCYDPGIVPSTQLAAPAQTSASPNAAPSATPGGHSGVQSQPSALGNPQSQPAAASRPSQSSSGGGRRNLSADFSQLVEPKQQNKPVQQPSSQAPQPSAQAQTQVQPPQTNPQAHAPQPEQQPQQQRAGATAQQPASVSPQSTPQPAPQPANSSQSVAAAPTANEPPPWGDAPHPADDMAPAPARSARRLSMDFATPAEMSKPPQNPKAALAEQQLMSRDAGEPVYEPVQGYEQAPAPTSGELSYESVPEPSAHEEPSAPEEPVAQANKEPSAQANKEPSAQASKEPSAAPTAPAIQPAQAQPAAQAAPQAAAPEAQALASETQAADDGFPATWRDFVTGWAKAKPFLARIVEDAHLIHYSRERIHLAVDPKSMAGSKLLATDKQHSFREDFKALFGFEGSLEVMSLEDYRKGAQQAEPLAATLLEVKTEEKQRKHEQIIDDAKNHPLTQSALELFGGKIESIDIVDNQR